MSEKISSIIPRITLGDLLYVLERISFGLTRLDIFHLYLDRLVHQGQLFFLDYPLVGKDGLTDDLGLASCVAFLNNALYGCLVGRAQIYVHGLSLNTHLMSIKAFKYCSLAQDDHP
ncbi:MAG: hypothetical protein WB392_00745 [Methanotrichaceae archaeon]